MRDLVIDTQHHFVPPRYHALLTAAAAGSPEIARGNASILALDEQHPARRLLDRLPELDAAGIDVAVVSLPPPGALIDDAPAAATAVSTANDEIAAACAQEPERFVMLAALPLPDLEAATAELERVATLPAVRGLCLGVNSLGFRPDRAGIEPLLARAAELSLAVVLHPAGREPGPAGSLLDYGLGAAFENMLWSSVAALRMVLSGMLDRLPELDVVVPHLGGVIPYLTQRLVEQSTGEAEHELTHYLSRRLYYDSCSFHPPALRCAIDTVGAGRIMLGSDYPFRGALGRCVEDALGAGLDGPSTRNLLGGTAGRWFDPCR